MRKLFVAFLIAICMSSFGCSTNMTVGKEIDIGNPTSIGDVAKIVAPAIVGISGDSETSSSVGSGVCVTESGHILTNSHVVNGCSDIVLYLSDKTQTTAEIVYEDTILDLAILKSEKNIPYLNIGDSDQLSVGEDILAVGTPLSLTLVHSFTKGIVSALNRTLKVGGTSGEGYMQNLIQHDASLNPGNSGGPLINSRGEVVGINTLKISSGEGIGFAIPSKSFKTLLGNFVKNINYEIPYLGVYGFDNEIANFYGVTDFEDGFYILDVANASSLKNAGIEKGSVITKINNAKIKNTLDLKNELYKFTADDIVDIEFMRNGKLYCVHTRLDRNACR